MELSLEKINLINRFDKMILKIEYEFLQNKLFQPIGIELSTVPIKVDVEETFLFKKINSPMVPPAYYDPIDDVIHIYAEHYSFLNREFEYEQYVFLMFLLFHEAGHKLFMTSKRENSRDHELWNIATDLEIHNMYYVYSELIKKSSNFEFKKYCEYIDKFLILKKNDDENLNEGLFEYDYLDNIAEEIYQLLLNSKKTKTEKYFIRSDGTMVSSSSNDENQDSDSNTNKEQGKNLDDTNGSIEVTISEYTLPSGKKIKTSNIDYSNIKASRKSSEQENTEENSRNLRKTILETTLKEEAERVKQKGDLSNKVSSFLKKKFKIKVDWAKILRNSLLSALEKSDYFSWSRPRLSLYGIPDSPYLPSQCSDFESYGSLIVALDESGSMSDEEISKAANIIIDAKAHYKKIIIIKHDTEIASIDEFDEINDDVINSLFIRKCCGGTSHKKVFEWVREYYIKCKMQNERLSCFISISDLESDIETCQDIIPSEVPKIYLTPEAYVSNHKSIKGIIIPVEL